jgi:hypothetical protein
MSDYDVTDEQKSLLRLIVKCDDEDKLAEKGFVMIMRGDDKYSLFGCRVELESLADLDALCDAGLLSREYSKRDPVYRIMNAARRAIANDFHAPPAQSVPQVTIGAIIQTMSGGNVQAVGHAQESEISQVINDPELLRSHVQDLTDRLLNEVKPALSTDDYQRYFEAIQDLKKEVQTKEPNPNLIKRLVRTIGLLGDVEGTIGLMTRLWPLIQVLLMLVAAKLSQGF